LLSTVCLLIDTNRLFISLIDINRLLLKQESWAKQLFPVAGKLKNFAENDFNKQFLVCWEFNDPKLFYMRKYFSLSRVSCLVGRSGNG
jgi:hypothetical protein